MHRQWSVRLPLYPGEHVDELARRVEATVAATTRKHPLLRDFKVDVLYDGFRCDGYSLPHDAPLVTALAGASERVTGELPPLLASTATTDARSFHVYGDTPAVCFGPYAEAIHGVNERVYLPSVVGTAQTLAL